MTRCRFRDHEGCEICERNERQRTNRWIILVVLAILAIVLGVTIAVVSLTDRPVLEEAR